MMTPVLTDFSVDVSSLGDSRFGQCQGDVWRREGWERGDLNPYALCPVHLTSCSSEPSLEICLIPMFH